MSSSASAFPAGATVALLLRGEWRGRPGTEPPGEERPLVRAAAALGAGEPRRAQHLIAAVPTAVAPDIAAVAAAMGHLAATLDRNWFPGGGAAVLEPGDLTAVAAAGNAPVAETDEGRMLVVLCRDLLAALPVWRRVVAGPGGAAVVRIQADAALDRLTELGGPVDAARLEIADVLARAGEWVSALEMLDRATAGYRASGDHVGLAACDLVLGDRMAAPSSHPELFGEQLEPGLAPGAAGDDAAAATRWAEAERRYAAADAPRGIAAVALRRAGLAVAAGEPGEAVALLERAGSLAREAGDGALARLADVHGALARIDAGEPADVEAVGAETGRWGVADGSRSVVRGLTRLCVARAARWRETDLRRSRRAYRLADALAGPIDAVVEAAILTGERARTYQAANYRRAAFVLATAELEDARAAATPLDGRGWGALVERVAAASRDGQALRDAAAVERVDGYARWLRENPPTGALASTVLSEVGPTLDDILAERAVYAPLYRGVAARDAGDDAAAGRAFDEALTAARAAGPLPTAVVLGFMRRFDEAVPLVDALADALPADALTALYVRLRRYDAALETASGAVPTGPPWEFPGIVAEAELGAGDPPAAATRCRSALSALEDHLSRLELDVFRTMATDDLGVAGLYTTAVRAHAVLADGSPGSDLARSFELSDRCRACSLADLVAQDDLPKSVGSAAAVRAWQRAGVELARTVEEVADLPPGAAGAAEMYRAVHAAADALDDAEAELADLAPQDFRARRRLPDTPALDSVRARLAEGTLLLQFHTYDDELICWAVDRARARIVRAPVPTARLAGDVRRFHRTLARGAPGPGGTDDGRALAELLLSPTADELRACERLVVVPYGPLALLPFHALPFDGDVLGTGRTVSYLPAASLVPAEPQPGVPPDAESLVIGDPAFAVGGLPRLPGTRVEAVAVGRLRGSAPLLDDAACHGPVLERLASARIVHLATHGILREGAPYSARLALAGADSLTVGDLTGVDTAIDLAVLSACDSGRGRATAAGDLIGLSRSLIAAGARELVVSLWPVDDMLACLTMVALHEELRSDGSVSAGLARAQRRIRALTREQAEVWYRELSEGVDPIRSVRSARDFRPRVAAGPDPADAYSWAPFIHIGTS